MPHPPADRSWFTFDSPAQPGLRVYAFSGTEEIHKPYEFEIELVAESPEVEFSDLLGRPACLGVADKSGGVRHVHGLIRHFRQLHTANLRTHYRCVLVPRLWFLSLVTDHRIFQNMTVLQIIEQVLKEQNFTGDAYAFKCFYDYPPREYCVQYGETALHFISRLCEEEGVYYYFEHRQDGHVLCFSDREGGPPIPGESQLLFHPGAGTETDTATVREAELNQAIGSDAVTFRDWNFRKTRLDLQIEKAETDPVKAPVPVGMTLEQYRFPHLYQLRKDGDRYAGIELLRHFSLSRWIDAATDVSRMTPGHAFELRGHHRPDLNGRWWIVRVEHRGEQPQVLEHEAPDRGMTYAASVQAIPHATRFVPASRHGRNHVRGDQTAIVTGPEGEEIFPDQYGRVKVQFHWDRLGGQDENTTCWIRVSQGWAGGQFGTMAIPRIGQEVVVSFLEGDPDRPIITGRVYNAANPVPYPLPTHKTRTVLKSLSTPGGGGFNELRIEDKKGQEEIYAHAEKDVNVYVKNDWKERILHDQHRTIDNFSYSLVKGEDQQTVHKDRKAELLADDHLTVRGSSHTHVQEKWLVRAGREVHGAAGRKAVIEAGAELTIKAGGSFIRIDSSGVYVGGTKVRINSGGSPGSGSGARPLLPMYSELVDEGTAPITQIDALRGVVHEPFCAVCSAREPVNTKEQYDEMVELSDLNGRPISNYPYYAETESGDTYFGRTDEYGCTCRVKTVNAQNVMFFFGDEALQKLKGEINAE
jgi:type VI secretion system secreted protein VgrG